VTDYFKPSERDNLFRRLEELAPMMRSRDSPATIVHRAVQKWLALHLIPGPESRPRSDAAVKRFAGQKMPSTYAADHAALVAPLQQFDERGQQGQLAPYPVFGSRSRKEWGSYRFLHIDHHLANFGIYGEPHVPQRSPSA
jgi:Protein of unknown function (DUF1569)